MYVGICIMYLSLKNGFFSSNKIDWFLSGRDLSALDVCTTPTVKCVWASTSTIIPSTYTVNPFECFLESCELKSWSLTQQVWPVSHHVMWLTQKLKSKSLQMFMDR